MQQDLSIQTKRKHRSRVYGVFPTYSLREYYKDYAREVDRKNSFEYTLGREGRRLESFETRVDP
jgi:hypothetical protein